MNMRRYLPLLGLMAGLALAQTPAPVQVQNLPRLPSNPQTSDYLLLERVGSTFNPGLTSVSQLQSVVTGPGVSWLGNVITPQYGGTGLAGSITGLVRANGISSAYSVAAYTDVTNIWTQNAGSCPASSTIFLASNGGCYTPSGSGTVTSVTITPTAYMTATGCTITSSGTCALSWTGGQTGNQVLATPNGSSGALATRALVAADIPAISLTAGVSGVLPAANGGTGVNNSTNTLTITGGSAKFAAPASGNIGTLEVVPSSTLTGNTTLNSLTYNGEAVPLNCSSACTITIPANSTTAFPQGTCISLVAAATSAAVTVAVTTDTFNWIVQGQTSYTTGNRTITPPGQLVACKLFNTTTWFVLGAVNVS